VEHGVNPLIDEHMDAIWWAFTTITTVGFGDIVPATFLGRLVGIFLMLLGTGLFACYVALISQAFIAVDLKTRKRELK
jgi:voltage-gated potassium channel